MGLRAPSLSLLSNSLSSQISSILSYLPTKH
jgi:hypothetical protein